MNPNTCQALQRQPGAGLRLLDSRPVLQRLSVKANSIGLDFLRPAGDMEKDRVNCRSVYDHPQWQKHRSPTRLFDRLQTIPASKMLLNTVPTLAWVGLISSSIALYSYCHSQGLLPEGYPELSPSQGCKTFISSTTVALTLLLVFRTNNGYGRWDEARKLWGLLVNRSRDMARQTVVLFPDEEVEAKRAMIRWLVAFPRLMRIFLQPEVTLDSSDLSQILTPKEFQMLKSSGNITVSGIHALSEIMHKAVRDPVQQLQLSNNLTTYHDVLGGCERLLRAPIPVSYTRHTARFLFVWLTLLPFTIMPTGPAEVAACVGVAAVLAITEEIGVQCEEPFGVLPLEAICNRIRADVENTLRDDEQTKAILREEAGLKGYNEVEEEKEQPLVVYRNGNNGSNGNGRVQEPVVVYTEYYM